MRRKTGIKVLDIGCAKGFMVRMLREGGMEAYGVDVSEYAINTAPPNVKSYLHLVDVESETLPFHDEFFDLVVSMSTFEHLHLERLVFVFMRARAFCIINVPSPLNKTEAKKPEHITMMKRENWTEFVEKFGFSFDPRLSELFDAFRVKEIAMLYISCEHAFSFMGRQFFLPKWAKAIVPLLMELRRKLLAPNFSLVFSRV
jgi:SAM-dependent methyltransferase